MPRPFRPNPFPGEHIRIDPKTLLRVSEAHRPWTSTHVKQETLREKRIRMRKEAEERQAIFDALPVSEKNERNPERRKLGMLRPYVEVAKAA